MVKRVIQFMIGASILTSCDILPHDYSNPRHAWYVASGQKDADRHEWHAAILVCMTLMQPLVDAQKQECLNEYHRESPEEACSGYDRGGFANVEYAVYCADALTSFHSAARHEEFSEGAYGH